MIETQRLLLRRWKASDLEPFSAMGQDPEVMRHFPKLLTLAECEAMISNRIEAHFERHGFGFWAVERIHDRSFLGFVGIAYVGFACPIEDKVEVGWRLASHAWGYGYAHEAASAVLQFGFDQLELDQIYAMTVVGNQRSRRLMEKLGMARAPAFDFDHPWIEEGHLVRPQIVYRKAAPPR